MIIFSSKVVGDNLLLLSFSRANSVVSHDCSVGEIRKRLESLMILRVTSGADRFLDYLGSYPPVFLGNQTHSGNGRPHVLRLQCLSTNF